MTCMVTTAISGEVLRLYSARHRDDPKVAVFPESGLSPTEQSNFLRIHSFRYEEIITFSSYIISDAPNGYLRVLDAKPVDINIQHGQSVNSITAALGCCRTIGSMASERLTRAASTVEGASSPEDIQRIIDDVTANLGDSVEKNLFISTALRRKCTLKLPS